MVQDLPFLLVVYRVSNYTYYERNIYISVHWEQQILERVISAIPLFFLLVGQSLQLFFWVFRLMFHR